MAFYKNPKSNSSVKGQLKNLAREVGIETIRELKETGKEILRFGAESKNNQAKNNQNWAQEWLKDQGTNRPPISDNTGEHSTLDLKNQFGRHEQQELKQVQAKLSQLFSQQKEKQTEKSVYEQSWQGRQEQAQQRNQKQMPSAANLQGTGSARQRGDWRHGAKRKRQSTPQELNRTEFKGSKGQ